MKTGRRSFLKGVGGATAAAFALRGERVAAAVPPPNPGFGSRQVLELEGQIVGVPQSAEGGGASAVVKRFLDSGLVVRKDVVDIHYEALRLEVGPGMSKSFNDWVSDFFDRDFQSKNGAVVTANYNYKEMARREFQDAVITEVAFPTLDASSKDAAFLTVGIQPESSHFELGKGGNVQPPGSGKIQKKWVSSNFKFELDGLDSATKKVSKVDAFTLQMKLPHGRRGIFDSAGHLEVPNIALTVPIGDVEPFLDWFEDFVVKGDNGPASEKNGAIVCLSPNLKDEILRVELSQVGIVSINDSKQAAGTDSVKRFRVELYVEKMKLDMK
jgi:hypothetical protein